VSTVAWECRVPPRLIIKNSQNRLFFPFERHWSEDIESKMSRIRCSNYVKSITLSGLKTRFN
jgi:hypothetical protein